MSSIVIVPASIRINACLREILASGSSASRSTSGNEPVSGSHRPIRLLPSSSGNSWPLRPPRTTDSFALNGAPAAAAVDGALSGAAAGLISPVGASDLGISAAGASAAGASALAVSAVAAGAAFASVLSAVDAAGAASGYAAGAAAGAAELPAPAASFAPHPSQ